jgi:hypothetical protein
MHHRLSAEASESIAARLASSYLKVAKLLITDYLNIGYRPMRVDVEMRMDEALATRPGSHMARTSPPSARTICTPSSCMDPTAVPWGRVCHRVLIVSRGFSSATATAADEPPARPFFTWSMNVVLSF